ncbi:Eukaryotic translation initiation factor 2A Short=eIF-2A [Serendipita indica DSM 11827]|nr:Eukaryotic translation initiation factor 2A Short=eIF-2A [Serendipita indica DSM 11827]
MSSPQAASPSAGQGQAQQPYAQYSFRAQKSVGLVQGPPSYEPCSFEKPEGTARATQYSADGRFFGIATPDKIVIISTATLAVIQAIELPSVVEIGFSPKGTFLSSWERQQKADETGVHKNLKVWNVQTGEQVASFGQKNQEDGICSTLHPSRNWAAGATSKLRLEGVTTAVVSPGANPSIAVFIPEKAGTPGSIRVYNLSALTAPPACQKSFFKADRVTIKWNSLGTLALIMTHTEVDKSNKSYYGETGMYLLSAAGNFDSRIVLDKEGPIHDFAWNPNSKEFCVVYGFMPAKATLFDQRVKPIFEFGAGPHNFVSWNPHGRLVALAGFGNLAGKVEIFDRRTLNKISDIDAPNTSHFEWSHDGTTIMTATLSPRLRVDNGIKLWWCNGTLLHVQLIDELYQAHWRPIARGSSPPFPVNIPAAPVPSESAQAVPAKPAAAKPAGAYRPPGAQGRAAPSIFKREDEGGGSGTHTPPRGVPGSMGYADGGMNGHGRGGANGYIRGGGRGDAPRGRGQGGRHVPGAAPVTPPASGTPPPPGGEGDKTRRKKGKGRREDGEGGGSGSVPPSGRATPVDGYSTPRGQPGGGRGRGGAANANNTHAQTEGEGGKGKMKIAMPAKVEQALLSVPADVESPLSPGADGMLDPTQKRIRNLNKKLKAIEELKEKLSRGEKLEATQYKKIETEAEIRKELSSIV